MKFLSYKVPSWLEIFQTKSKFNWPLQRLKLVNEPTPIEKLNLPESNYEIYVKRDDLTHSDLCLQGNKLRKLEFLFADALVNHKAKHILTAGGLQSNHCRAVAALANRFGLKSHLFLRSHTNKPFDLNFNGNLLVNQLLGANIYLIEKRAQYLESIEYKMNILEEKLNEPSYKIPIGGSNITGLFGYLECFNEMLQQQHIDEFIDDIIVTTGSGGTMAGLAIANYLTGSRIKIHAFCVCDNKAYFNSYLSKEFTNLTQETINPNKLVNIIECSKGLGYAQSTQLELEFIAKFFQQTNILLDPVYTGKTLFTLMNLLNDLKPTLAYTNDEAAFSFKKSLKGNRILFLHTGGQLGVFDTNKFDIIFKNKSNIFNYFS